MAPAGGERQVWAPARAVGAPLPGASRDAHLSVSTSPPRGRVPSDASPERLHGFTPEVAEPSCPASGPAGRAIGGTGMRGPSSALDRFLHEVYRRRLLSAAGTYTIVCWFLVQVAATAVPLFGLPEWTVRAGLALTVLGLPIVLGAAWLVNAHAPAAGGDGPLAAGGSEEGGGAAPRVSRGFFTVLVALVLLGAIAWIYRVKVPLSGGGGAQDAPASPRTVAVLPFATLSESRDDAYFSDGVTEEIMNAVAQIPGVSVVARSASFAFRERPDLDEIRAQTGAGSALEGSVRRAGDRVRVDVALVDTRTHRRVWAADYDRRLRDIFALEDEIARAVASALAVELTTPAARSIGTQNVPAHDLYLLGLYHWNRRTGPEIRQAVDYFERAVEADSSFALAYAGLAAANVLLPLYADVPGDDAYPRARDAAERALALDDRLAEAHTALANVLMIYRWDWEAADAEFRRAIALDSTYATAHEWRGLLLDGIGRHEEAAAEFRRARAADPASLIIVVAGGLHEAIVARQDSAAAAYRRALDRQPDFPVALSLLAESEAITGNVDAARAALERWAALRRVDPAVAVALAAGIGDPAALAAGRKALASAALRSRMKPFDIAVWASLLGDTAGALSALERGAVEHDYLSFSAAVHPAFQALRGSPRYRALLARMHLH